MGLKLEWVGEEAGDEVAQTRMRCFGHSTNAIERFRTSLMDDGRAKDGDILLARRDGEAVGTAASLSMTMWMRGKAVPMQGVAWVGAVKTHRRRASAGLNSAAAAGAAAGATQDVGVATAVMQEVLAKGRERGEAISGLMPFRASFYEHFGYGLAETRQEWSVPIGLLPTGCQAMRFAEEKDLPAMHALRQRCVERGQCDVERSAAYFAAEAKTWGDGITVVEEGAKGKATGYLAAKHAHVAGKDVLKVVEMVHEDAEAMQRQLHFLASLKDQYATAVVTVPPSVPFNLLLKEPTLPHRLVNHAVSEMRTITRMQLRVIDHWKLLDGMQLLAPAAGRVDLAVHESEGTVSRIRLEMESGRITAGKGSAKADVEMADKTWAAIVAGSLDARNAAAFGLIDARNAKGPGLLSAFGVGPAPFCTDYF